MPLEQISIRVLCMQRALPFWLLWRTLDIWICRAVGGRGASSVSPVLFMMLGSTPPQERVRIASCSFSNIASAIVTLDDGRELRVVFVGSQVVSAEGASHAAIEVLVDDPALAAMSPEELRARAQLLISNAHWCEHWRDDSLLESAMEQARELAADGLDLLDEVADLPLGTTPQEIRETLLHRKAKEILEREMRIMVPQMAVAEPSPEWPQEPIIRKFREAQMLELDSVALEQRTGRIIPDVTATTVPAPGCPVETLLMEITVTNGINEERRARILGANLPALEIDLSRLGGRVTEAEFTRLIVEELAGKRWLHHPAIEVERSGLQTPRRERASDGPSGGGRVPPRFYPEPKNLWLKGEALGRWEKGAPRGGSRLVLQRGLGMWAGVSAQGSPAIFLRFAVSPRSLQVHHLIQGAIVTVAHHFVVELFR